MVLGRLRSTSISDASFTRRASDYFGMSGPSEFVAAASLLGLLVVLNVFNVLHQRFDSDEPQHLHVIWGWTRGLIQYRDLLDNHMPLFHIMFAPILGVIGERASTFFDAFNSLADVLHVGLVHLPSRDNAFLPSRRRLGGANGWIFQ